MIAHNQIKPGKVEAMARLLEKEFIPSMKKIPGFRGCYMVAGPKGEYTCFVLWENRANADAYVSSPGRQTALKGIGEILEGPMKLEFGEVAAFSKA
jgi:antibiotic biosynthesis monooxygenase (ABM) superfamily enzyme